MQILKAVSLTPALLGITTRPPYHPTQGATTLYGSTEVTTFTVTAPALPLAPSTTHIPVTTATYTVGQHQTYATAVTVLVDPGPKRPGHDELDTYDDKLEAEATFRYCNTTGLNYYETLMMFDRCHYPDLRRALLKPYDMLDCIKAAVGEKCLWPPLVEIREICHARFGYESIIHNGLESCYWNMTTRQPPREAADCFILSLVGYNRGWEDYFGGEQCVTTELFFHDSWDPTGKPSVWGMPPQGNKPTDKRPTGQPPYRGYPPRL